jgi:hypothetical protein
MDGRSDQKQLTTYKSIRYFTMRRCLLYIDLLDSLKHKLEQGDNYPPRINGISATRLTDTPWKNGISATQLNDTPWTNGISATRLNDTLRTNGISATWINDTHVA